MIYEMDGRIFETSINTDVDELHNYSTVHGFVRTMERADKTEQQAVRMIKNAWFRGKTIDQLPLVKQKDYVTKYNSLLLDGYTNLRVYCGYLFIFAANGRLITMHPLPRRFDKKNMYDAKARFETYVSTHAFARM